jgi:hypothetical protein
MSEQRKENSADDIRNLIEEVDGRLREAERIRSYVNERAGRPAWWPERRRVPRVPPTDEPDRSTD